MLTVAGNGADDGVLLATKAVGSALDVGLGLGGLVFDLALGVLLLARLRPGGRTSDITDGLDDGTLEGVVLAGDLPL